MKKQKIFIYTDGGSRGNPGIAGSGAAIVDEAGRVLKECCEHLGIRTNNWAEYQAVILGLENVKKMFGGDKTREMEVEIRMDSELVCRQLSGQYQIKEETLFSQFIKVWNLRVKDFPNLTFKHIPREENSAADRLANLAMDQGASGCNSQVKLI
ncbi:MAG: ribonuclease HI family protein [Candidatus Paceibacterota bacterium]|jgi:ribonuclease HI